MLLKRTDIFGIFAVAIIINSFSLSLSAMEPASGADECQICLEQFDNAENDYRKITCKNKKCIYPMCSYCFKRIMGKIISPSGDSCHCPFCFDKMNKDEFNNIMQSNDVSLSKNEKEYLKTYYGDNITGNPMFDVPAFFCERTGVGYWHIAPVISGVTAYICSDICNPFIVAAVMMAYTYFAKEGCKQSPYPERKERGIKVI
jgi:hypothetical protein